MKLLRFGDTGSEKPGLMDAAGCIRDLSGLVPDIAGEVLSPDSLARLGNLDTSALPRVDAATRLGACVGRVGKLVCIGLNYSDHAAETGMAVPDEPTLFMKATSSICGPDDPIVLPPGAQKTDWEAELAFVIGREARWVDSEDWRDFVAGFCVCNDVSERAMQLEGTGQWVKGKSADSFGPLGPWLVTVDEIPDPNALDIWCEVDARRYQDGNTRTMIFGIPHLLSYVSRFMSLQPGDVVSTGTPPGVGLGQKPPVFLKAGQTVRLGVAGLGVQTHRVVAADKL